MSEESKTGPFHEFADQSGDYYAKTFLKIQKSELPKTHINVAAALGSFIWASLRGNWLLFWIAFAIDLVTLVYLGAAYKFNIAGYTVIEEVAKYGRRQQQTIADRTL